MRKVTEEVAKPVAVNNAKKRRSGEKERSAEGKEVGAGQKGAYPCEKNGAKEAKK